MEAKALAEEQKRLNPDCWKRKRTNSVSPTANSKNTFQLFEYLCTICKHSVNVFDRVPSRLNQTARTPAAGVLEGRGYGQSWIDRLMPLYSPAFLILNCDAEFTSLFNLETL